MTAATALGAPLFQVSSHHTAAGGAPPAVDGDAAGMYVGYFVNEYGEQAIYTYDHQTGATAVRMGDTGWHDTHRVNDGEAEGLALTQAEALWLRSCWLATGGVPDRPPPGAGDASGRAEKPSR